MSSRDLFVSETHCFLGSGFPLFQQIGIYARVRDGKVLKVNCRGVADGHNPKMTEVAEHS